MKKLTRILMVAALSALTASALAFAQQPSPTPAAGQQQQQESDDEAKRRLYTCYYNNYSSNQAEAYRCAQEYVQRFGNGPADEYLTAIRGFITSYEASREAAADNAVYEAINRRDYPTAFRLGRERLAARPDNLKMMINLAWAGLQATVQGTNPPADITTQAITYANQSLQAIQAGRTPAGEGPTVWAPFGSREDAISWLNYALGTMNLRTNPTEAANYLRRVAEGNGAAKREPTTYSYLAFAYNTEYERMRTDYQNRFPPGSPETPESRAALETLNGVIDRLMDAYARAINASNAQQNPQQYQTQRAEWTAALTSLWRFRNNDSEEGLQAFISGAATRPLPQPGQPPMTMPNQRPATTTTTTGTTPPSSPTQPSTTTPNTTAPTTTRPSTTPPANNTTRPATNTTRPGTTQPRNTTRPTTQQPTNTTRPTASSSSNSSSASTRSTRARGTSRRP